MATIKLSDLHSTLPTSISNEEEFIGAVSSAVIRALDSRQLQEIRGGFLSPGIGPIVLGIIFRPIVD